MKKQNIKIIVSSILQTQQIMQIIEKVLKEAVIKRCPKCDQDDRPKSQQQWCLYTKDESRLLGRHPSKQKAKEQEKAVQYFKHKGKVETNVEETESETESGVDKKNKAIPTDGNLNLFNEI